MGELTNANRKLYASLANAKGRKECGLFMAQGTKCVLDTIEHFRVHDLLCTQAWLDAHRGIGQMHDCTIVKSNDMQRISTLSTPPDVIAIYAIPETGRLACKGQLSLALDCVQDPGNLGTIIRVADWMGVNTIVASTDTVDVWSPKVVQATMGAISRVTVHYIPLPDFLSKCRGMNIYGTYLDGADIYKSELSADGIIVMGNEGNGIRPEVSRHINQRLYIPPYPSGARTSESLNVAVATAITLSEFRRRM